MNHHKWLSVWGWVVKSLPDRIRFSLHLPRAGPERRIVPKSRHDETFRRITPIHRYPSHRMIGILGSAGDHSLQNTHIVFLFPIWRNLLSLFLISKMLAWLCTIYRHGGGARRLNIFEPKVVLFSQRMRIKCANCSELQPLVDGDDAIDDDNVMTPVLNDLLQRMFPNVSLLWRKLLPAACYQNSSHSHTETKMSATISSRWGSIYL